MSFDVEVMKPGRGRAIRADFSTDNFATIAYRYGDVAGPLDGTNHYQARILELGPVRRALAQNRITASSTTSLKLANADGGVDWVAGRENIVTAASLRVRLYVALYGAGDATLTFTSKLLGEFTLSSWPQQDNETVTLELADDFMGLLGAGLLLPTFEDWMAVGDSTNNPFANNIGLPSSLDLTTPIQLAFGEDYLLAYPHVIPWGNNGNGEPYEDKVIVPLFCTLDTDAVDQNLVTGVVAQAYTITFDANAGSGQPFYSLPRFVNGTNDPSQAEDLLRSWTVEKSPVISKGGLNFYIVYLVVRDDLGLLQFLDIAARLSQPSGNPVDEQKRLGAAAFLSAFAYSGGYPVEAVDSTGSTGAGGTDPGAYRYVASRVVAWYVKAAPKSQITNAVAPSLNSIGVSRAADVVQDLVSEYSAATIDAASFARVRAGSPFAAATGVVQPWTERAAQLAVPPIPLSLRQALTAIAQSADMDIFVNWDGEIALSSDVYDYQTALQAGIVEVREEELNDGTMRWMPSDGERHAPFNRVSFSGGKADPPTGGEIPYQGPFDLPAAEVPTTTRVIEATLPQGWRPYRQQALNPWQWRSVDGRARDIISFSMHMGGLRLELGGYFRVTWTRGVDLGGPYTSTVFQVESLTYTPATDVVQVTGVWRDDTVTERQYLLDDETLLVRPKGMMSGEAFPESGGQLVDFNVGINLTTMGVEVGDILVFRDSNEPEDEFLANACFRIISIPDVNQVNVALPGFDPSVPLSISNADWSIVRGATTYPTAVSDPTNYADGGDMYGKVTDADGEYSNAATGNRLISG